MTDDLEMRKRIAEQAQTGAAATDATPAVRAFQFFLVPLLIVGACVLVYVLFSAVIVNPRSPKQWLIDVQNAGVASRPHAMLQLTQALRRQPDTNLTPDLIDLYKKSPSVSGPESDELNIRRYVAQCLGILKDRRATPLLLEGAKGEPNMEARVACIDALGTIKDPSTLPDLVKLLDDSNPGVRKYAAFNAGAVAGETGDTTVIDPLRKLLADPQADVGWNAAFALAYFLKDGAGTDILKKMLDRKYLSETIGKDPEAELLTVRAIFTACNAAVKLKDPSFVPLLRKRTDPAEERASEVRYAAHDAIARIEAK